MENHRLEISKILRMELGRRVKANPSYSLRAFAKSLDCDASLLSKIMNAKRDASPAFVLRLSRCSSEVQKQIQRLLGQTKMSRETKPRSVAKRGYSKISLNTFEAIADPIHYKVLEITKLKSFRPDTRWMAQTLSCSVHRVNEAVERLKSLGLLEIRDDGVWRDLTGEVATHVVGANVTTIAHRAHQKQVLEEALNALEQVPVHLRDQSSMMMASSADRIEKAKAMIRTFRRDLCQFLEEAEEKDTVLQLSVSLFPLTRERNQKNEKIQSNEKDVSNEI